MGLKETQAALARLLTETPLREQFYAAPDSVGAALGLDANDTGLLQALAASKADEIANALQNKRRAAVGKLLPQTARMLGNRFAPLFRRFAAGSAPRGVKKHTQDALAFAAFLRESDALRGAPAWRREVIRCEAFGLQREGKSCMVRFFLHDVSAIANSDFAAQTPRILPSLLVWLQLSQKANGRVFLLRIPFLPGGAGQVISARHISRNA